MADDHPELTSEGEVDQYWTTQCIELRRDPDDWSLYTKDELMNYYIQQFDLNVVDNYWNNECMRAETQNGMPAGMREVSVCCRNCMACHCLFYNWIYRLT